MSDKEEFEENWSAYMSTYQANVNVEAYEEQLNQEIQKKNPVDGIMNFEICRNLA